jgi:hypothetical protein
MSETVHDETTQLTVSIRLLKRELEVALAKRVKFEPLRVIFHVDRGRIEEADLGPVSRYDFDCPTWPRGHSGRTT